MLIGPGGVGKSSLLNGLMNLPLPHEAYSTQLADTYAFKRNDRPSETFWAKQVGGYWVKVTDQDEIDELVHLVETVSEKNKSKIFSDIGASESGGQKFAHSDVQPIVTELAANLKSRKNVFISGTEVYMRVWDCGGQPVFLDILPAFLTARTLFLLMFDARHDLRQPCIHLSHHNGKAKEEQEEITTLELLTQWMATIHATLLKRDSSDSEHSSGNEEERFPQILPIGTHGDDAKVRALNEATIFDPLTSACADKAFMHLLVDGHVVDNTTAGKGSEEDPSFQAIRDIADKFASTDVAIRTPVKWVLFRKVFERYAKGKPVVSLDKVKELCRECDIPEETMDSVLAFYHDLAVFFHYKHVPSLQKVVISDPQWLVRQMAKILALEGFETVKNINLWKLLRENGILLEPLYTMALSTQKDLSPQKIIDLLEDFLIIAEIHTTGKHSVPGREYFTPSLLPRCPADESSYFATSNQSAAPLHLIFSTKYLPPGFFTRLAAVLSKHPKCQVDFTNKIYRNEVKYLFGDAGQQVDKLVVTEKKFSICVQVQRVSTRSFECPTFISMCSELFQILQDSFRKVKKWLPQIDVSFALECEECAEKGHFIPLSAPRSITPNISLLCHKNVRTILNSDQKFWLNIHQDHPSNPDLSDREIFTIAREVEKLGKVSELAQALEMTDHTDGDATVLLQRWRKEMTSLGTPTRKDLLYHLTSFDGLQHLSKWLLYDEIAGEKFDKVQELKQQNDQLKSENDLLKSENVRLKSEIDLLKSGNDQPEQRHMCRQPKSKTKISSSTSHTGLDQHARSSPSLIPRPQARKKSQTIHDPKLSPLERLTPQPRQYVKVYKRRTTPLTSTSHTELDQRARSSPSLIPQPQARKKSQIVQDPKLPSRRLDVTDHNLICDKLRPYAYLWRTIGQGLGFLAAELNCIEADPKNLINAPASYLYAMLDSWLQWAPGDDRGSRDYATVRSLSTAVDKAGLGALAQELRLGWKKK